MAAVTSCTSYSVAPQGERIQLVIITPATADSADTIDVSSATATGGRTLSSIDSIYAYDKTTGDSVTCTFSGTTITLDASGGTTDHTYVVTVIGQI